MGCQFKVGSEISPTYLQFPDLVKYYMVFSKNMYVMYGISLINYWWRKVKNTFAKLSFRVMYHMISTTFSSCYVGVGLNVGMGYRFRVDMFTNIKCIYFSLG